MSKVQRVMFVTSVGGIGGAGSHVDIKLQESPDNAVWFDIANSSIQQLNVGVLNIITTQEVRSDQLTQGRRYVRALVTFSGPSTGTQISVVPIATEAEYKPAKKQDDVAVVQRVVV